ncbi:MAG: hypothetical protein KF768_00185 [Phycisphaeraceae bacterium]|nr:hypothetical protein [Phycisphaeraceae bacterium]
MLSRWDSDAEKQPASAPVAIGQPGVPTLATPPGAIESRTDRSKLSAASAALLLGILGALVATVVVLLILRRARWLHAHPTHARSSRRRRSGASKGGSAATDAWSESAARLGTPRGGWRKRAGLEPGSDDDTVDLDPDELGPDALDDESPDDNGLEDDPGPGRRPGRS